MHDLDPQQLALDIKQWGRELGFQQVGITDTDLSAYAENYKTWLEKNYHGEMAYMAKNVEKRLDPKKMVPGAARIISVRMDYLPPSADIKQQLQNSHKAVLSRYALGRDYHKLMRKRLQKLADRISEAAGPFDYRAFTDSAPVLEKPIAEKAGLGWIGKNTCLINSKAGSWFFLGELYTDLPLPIDPPASEHCGSCRACIDICPTQAIVGPGQLDARRCISYLTIELRGSIPEALRPLMGNRIYGCDDCQLICPWNKFAKHTQEQDFHPRHTLDDADLIKLFAWNEEEFLKKTEGSAIRRIGHDCWLRNIAVALGNAKTSTAIVSALEAKENHPSALVREHVSWALAQHSSNFKKCCR